MPSNEMVYIVDDDASVVDVLYRSCWPIASSFKYHFRTRLPRPPREQQVLPLLVRGLLNKQAAWELGITEYTVQIHRGHIMRKMEVDSFATLVKLAGKLSLESPKAS